MPYLELDSCEHPQLLFLVVVERFLNLLGVNGTGVLDDLYFKDVVQFTIRCEARPMIDSRTICC
jgi:hypothetical protein